MDKKMRAEVLTAYEDYLTAFNNDNIDTINSLVAWPLSYIGDGKVTSLDQFPVKPSELKESMGWDRSEGFEIDVVAVTETKAHVLMRNTRRLRKDGSLIEEASAFYAFTRTGDGWKMFALSDVRMPA